MNNDLISRSALKEHKFVGNKYVQIGGRTNGKALENINRAYQQGWNDAIDAIINNAPTVPLPDFKEGYKQAIIDGKTNFSRPKAEWIFDSEFTMFGNPYGTYKCSICGCYSPNKYYFCKDCGADMKGGAV